MVRHTGLEDERLAEGERLGEAGDGCELSLPLGQVAAGAVGDVGGGVEGHGGELGGGVGGHICVIEDCLVRPDEWCCEPLRE